MKKYNISMAVFLLVFTACAPTQSPVSTKGHIDKDVIKPEQKNIPELVAEAPVIPKPTLKPETETYTVVVNDVDVASLLFALARDAKINIDVFQNISGKITLNAIDQTLPQILERIAEQSSIRYSIKDGLLTIRPDEPFFRTYKVDYVNIDRKTTSENLIATQISATGTNLNTGGSNSGSGGSNSGSGRSSGGAGNNSLTRVESATANAFWDSLTENISKIIYIEKKGKANKSTGLTDQNQRIIVNKETGFLTVKASEKQHRKIQQYIDLVVSSAKRQVLIEATIAEVTLTDEFQAGVDWSQVSNSGNTTFTQNLTGANLTAAPFVSGTFTNNSSALGTLTGTVKFLESFGTVKVLSSPKVLAINNQTAILKVVDNRVYFTVDYDQETTEVGTTRTYTSVIHTVPVGIVMQVTPFISGQGEVTLNVRPTISRIINFVNDPGPALAGVDVVNEIPEIQVREIESVLKVNSGDVAVIGGLMQDTVDESDSSVPFLAAIPIIGQLFNYSDDSHTKTELVIFLRPKVIKHADINADLADFKEHLPQFEENKEKTDNKQVNKAEQKAE